MVGDIGRGLLLLVGVERGDTEADADITARKIAALRLFAGRTPMDRTVGEVGGACLVVSQFTLAASLVQGQPPQFRTCRGPLPAPNLCISGWRRNWARPVSPVRTGRFGADMEVELTNDGPVTFLVFTRAGALLK